MLGYSITPDYVTANSTLSTKTTSVNLRAEPDTNSKVLACIAAAGTTIGNYAGYYSVDSASKKWYKFENGNYGVGWIREDLVKFTAVPIVVATNKDDEAQADLNYIAATDENTLNIANECAALLTKLKAKGVNTSSWDTQLKSVVTEVNNRQAEMQSKASSGTWGKITGTISSAASNTWASIKSFFGFSGYGRLGELITICVIAIIAVVVGAGTTAIVLTKPWKDKANVSNDAVKKVRKELEGKVDEDTLNQVLQIVDKETSKVYDLGKRQGTWSGFWSIGKWVLIAGAAWFFLPRIMDYAQKKRKPQKRS